MGTPCDHFARMIPNCLEYARAARQQGKPIIGILCEYTPRELILAAGAVPVCLCGGSAETIPAAEAHLPVNLCPMIKSTYGYHIQRSNPFLEMADLVVAETTCDGKKKMYELMAQTRPMYVLELPQKPDDPDAFEHWRRELLKFKSELERRFRVEISDCLLRHAIEQMNGERSARRRLASLMAADAPPLTGRQLLNFKSSISCIPADTSEYERAADLLSRREVDREVSGRVRVLMTGVPMAHGAERVLEIIENHGGLVVAMDNCVGLKPITEDVCIDGDDPITAIARKYFRVPCSVMTPNRRRLDAITAMAREYRAHCVIELIWQACLTYDVESHGIRQLAQTQLRLPYLQIQTDYSPSDSDRIGVRVQALFETIRGGGSSCG